MATEGGSLQILRPEVKDLYDRLKKEALSVATDSKEDFGAAGSKNEETEFRDDLTRISLLTVQHVAPLEQNSKSSPEMKCDQRSR